MNHNTLELMRQSKTIAQSVAPFDTGNLRYNAIRAYQTPTGFRIAMLYTAAFYGAILNEYGVRGGDTHKGWWSTNVYTKVSTFIHSSLNNRKSTFEQANKNVAKFAPDNPARQARFYNSQVADEGRDKFLAGV
jgi:hypothetical protein